MIKKKILLTGGNGFLGKNISLKIQKTNCELYKLSNTNDDSCTICDLENRNQVKELLSKEFDLIIHCAAIVPKNQSEYNSQSLYHRNELMLENLVKHSSCPIIFISSMTVYGVSNQIIRNEDDITKPESAYGKSKLNCEVILQNHKGNSLIIRLPGLFGESRPSGLIFNSLKALMDNTQLLLPDKPILWAAMHVDDAAQSIANLSKINFSGCKRINVSYDEEYSINNYIQILEEIFCTKIKNNIIHPKFQFDLNKLKTLKLESKRTLKSRIMSMSEIYA